MGYYSRKLFAITIFVVLYAVFVILFGRSVQELIAGILVAMSLFFVVILILYIRGKWREKYAEYGQEDFSSDGG